MTKAQVKEWRELLGDALAAMEALEDAEQEFAVRRQMRLSAEAVLDAADRIRLALSLLDSFDISKLPDNEEFTEMGWYIEDEGVDSYSARDEYMALYEQSFDALADAYRRELAEALRYLPIPFGSASWIGNPETLQSTLSLFRAMDTLARCALVSRMAVGEWGTQWWHADGQGRPCVRLPSADRDTYCEGTQPYWHYVLIDLRDARVYRVEDSLYACRPAGVEVASYVLPDEMQALLEHFPPPSDDEILNHIATFV